MQTTQPGEKIPYLVSSNPYEGYEIQPLVEVLPEALSVANTNVWSQSVTLAATENWSGLCFDLRKLTAAESAGALARLEAIQPMFDARNIESCVTIAPSQIAGLSSARQLPDRVIVPALQDQDRLTERKESPAPLTWFESVLADAKSVIPSERLVIGMPTGGVHWTSVSETPRFISYANAMAKADQFRGFAGFDADQAHGLISFMDQDGARNMIWYLDAVSHYSQLLALHTAGIDSVAMWGLGQEDPSIWPLLSHPDVFSDRAADSLNNIDLGSFVSYRGEGAFIRFGEDSRIGRRHIDRDPETNRILKAETNPLPVPMVAELYAALPDKTILLTFDDGPTETYTRDILNILRDEDVSATFFMVGNHMFEQKALVTEMTNANMDFGLHTFSHPEMDKVSPGRVKVELALQSRMFSWMTGLSPVVFRAPFVRGPGPLEGELARRIKEIVDQRYHLLGATIVPPDWRDLSAEQLVEFTLDKLDGTGQVIMLHDGGGNRATTVEALRMLIPELKGRGYEFLTLQEAMTQVGPAYETREVSSLETFESLAFSGVGNSVTWISYLVPFAVLLGVLRALALFIMAIRAKRLAQTDLRCRTGDFTPPVTVVIPAFNEATGIVQTIDSVLASDYPHLSVLVVDDGSTDGTYDLVVETYIRDPRIQILRQPNGGKWKAANLAFSHVTTDFVVAIDADTIVAPDAIRRLLQPMRQSDVGAVAGKVMVGNPNNLLTKLEKLEYTVAQNIDRRAYETINAIMVVPGAFGAWRTDAVRACGYYSSQTLAEDTDLTISLLKNGYKVRAAERAYAYTEAPASVGTLMKQRMRWSIGILQSAWKHRKTIRQGHAVGLIGLTDLVLFGVVMPLLGPIIDLLMVLMVVRFVGSFDGSSFNAFSTHDYLVMGIFLSLPMLEMIMADYAVRSEPSVPRHMVFLLLLNRLIYRQLLIINVYRSLWRIMTGRLTGWHKLRRMGSVRAPRRQSVAARSVSG
ncbi:glycosyltransferase [Phaeobacter sp.]|uniref:glycosyltransferase n=1 Tax=Phaeobacter sp. TaxID=1902409 RepID=UPI0025EF8974|nr:glycosyltransferase [Phaeobacter sp.]